MKKLILYSILVLSFSAFADDKINSADPNLNIGSSGSPSETAAAGAKELPCDVCSKNISSIARNASGKASAGADSKDAPADATH